MTALNSEELLAIVVQNGMNQDLNAKELAGLIVDAGYIHIMNGNIAADIIQWVAQEIQTVLQHADMAEIVALPEGTVGVEESIHEGETLREDPAEWLFHFAEKVRKGNI